MADAFLYKFPGRESIMDKHSISYLNVKISSVNFHEVDEIWSSVKLKLPNSFGYSAHDTTVHFRFRCSPRNVNQFGE